MRMVLTSLLDAKQFIIVYSFVTTPPITLPSKQANTYSMSPILGDLWNGTQYLLQMGNGCKGF